MSLKDKIIALSDQGIPIPMVRDPLKKRASITATMVVVAFGVCILGVLGKISKLLGEVDLTAAHSLLVISLSAYLGRKFQKDSNEKLVD